MTEPPWLKVARKYIGVYETPGKVTTPTIAKWLANLQAWWRDDETPWCGVFVAECMKESGIELPRHWYRARAWLEWGVGLPAPAVGSVGVLSRAGGGHVTLIVGRRSDGLLMGLGGNQGNHVGVAAFAEDRFLGFRYPTEYALARRQYTLPVLADNGEPISHNEA